MKLTKNFNSSEFDSPDKKDSGMLIDLKLVYLLQSMRDLIGEPLIITSGYRTKEHNLKIGGVSNSSHLTGNAVDIKCNNSELRFKIIDAAIEVGFKRIEVAPFHIHLDNDLSKPQNVCFLP